MVDHKFNVPILEKVFEIDFKEKRIKMVIVLCGNSNTEMGFFREARDVLKKMATELKRKKVVVGIGLRGRFRIVKKWTNEKPPSNALASKNEEELIEAAKAIASPIDECGCSTRKRLIYIGGAPSLKTIPAGLPPLYVISNDRKSGGFELRNKRDKWKFARNGKEIERELRKLLK